jgi:uncharacterized protein (DUF433 family)
MIQKVTVVFDGQVLRPDHALKLTPNQRYTITIETEATATTFDEWKTRLISDPNILGGETVFPNSRLSVRRVGAMLERGESLEVIKEDYPYLSDEDLQFAQRYVRAYPSMEQPTKG